MTGDSGADATAAWTALDDAWRDAFRLAWEAVTTGNIGVGAVITDLDGTVVAASRNRVSDTTAPPGEIAGSSLAHAEMNALARLAFRSPRELVLTTTLQPCLQCAAAIRMGPIAKVRVAGADPLWDGCGDFTSLNPWVARRLPVPIEGPRTDEVGLFGTLLARLDPGLVDHVAEELHRQGEGPLIALASQIDTNGVLEEVRSRSVSEVFVRLWPQLRAVSDARSNAAPL